MAQRLSLMLSIGFALSISGFADSLLVDTGLVNGQMATASRPSGAGKIETEAADDFVLGSSSLINSGTFTGLVPAGAHVTSVTTEIYRVFPSDSHVPPSNNVPTRNNSPSDVALDSRSSSTDLSFATSLLDNNFTAVNSVLNGIHKVPNQQTLGEGPVSGEEVQFSFTLSTPFSLTDGHYFFVPQVELDNGDFFWLSAVRPIVAPGIPFAPDLQAWIRNEDLDPDWLRIGSDIVGGATPPTFNAAFSLSGVATPEPASILLMSGGLLTLCILSRRKRDGS